jgi:hypothetical protein
MLTLAIEPAKPAQPKVGMIVALALILGGLPPPASSRSS